MRFLPLFIISLIACLLCIDTASGLSLYWITAPVLTAFLVSWPTAYLPHQLRAGVQLIIGELLIFVCIADCYCQEFFATTITPHILSNILLSESRESHEFLTTFVGFFILSRWRITALLLLCIALPLELFYLRTSFLIRKNLRNLGVVFLGFCFVCEISATYKYVQLFLQSGDLRRMEGLIFRHYDEEIPTPLHRLAFSWYSLKQSSQSLKDIKHSTFSAQIDNCSHLSPHIVLVIGESYNKHHSTLYGYHLQTTPLQQKRMDEGELFVFRDVVTPWNITSNVFLDIFSVWEYGMKEKMKTMPLFPILFKRAGYSVNFFSNQYIQKSFTKRETNQASHFFLSDVQMSDSLFTYRNKKSPKYDMDMLEQVLDYKKENYQSGNSLDIIHLIGQHFQYHSRYPDSYAKFSLSTYADRDINKEAKEKLMHYDNATYYNDMVLDSILSMYSHEDAIVLFVSDHGEEAYDDLPVFGRLFQNPISAQVRQEFEVPMWIWCSETYRKSHPGVVSNIKQAINKPFMTDGLAQILFSLAGISCQWTDETRNVLSSKYQCKQRLICGSVDYDKLMK